MKGQSGEIKKRIERWSDRVEGWRERGMMEGENEERGKMEGWSEGMEGEDGRRGSGGFNALINHSHFPTTGQTIWRKWDSYEV